MNKKLIIATAFTAISLTACSSVGAGQQAVEVDSWGDPTVSGCVKEETQTGTMTVDLYRFPARQITWDANNDPGAERGPYVALSNSSDQAEMAVPVTLTFDLTTDCEKLKSFYRDYATKDSGWLNDDGTSSDGWIKLLTYTVSQPAEQAVIAITQKYPWQAVWNDDKVRGEYKAALQARLPKDTAARTGGVEYFDNFQITVGKPFPTDQRLREAAALRQSSQAEADAERTRLTAQADAQKDAAVSQRDAAIAQRDAEVAKAQIVAAQIAGYPDVEAYLRALAIDKGISPWPSPIIAGAR